MNDDLKSKMEALKQERDVLLNNREIIEKKRAESLNHAQRITWDYRRESNEAKLREVESALASLDLAIKADEAYQTVAAIANKVSGELETLRKTEKDTKSVDEVEKQLSKLLDVSNQTIQQLKSYSMSGIEPKLSVVRPNVRLIDANLAYKYADLQGDFNVLIGFTTLFAGVFISSTVSLILSSIVSTDKLTIAIHAVVTIMSAFVSLIFGFLAWRSQQKANKAKSVLEAESGETELPLKLDVKKNDGEN